MAKNLDASKKASRRKPRIANGENTLGDRFDLSGDFRGATVNLKSTIVRSIEVKEIEDLPAEPGEAPFQGLQYFDEKDADRFFGRESLTAKIVGRLTTTRFLAVIGASGSGKSSVVRAGVIPALRRGERLADKSIPPTNSGQWDIRLFTPGGQALDALAASLTFNSESITAAKNMRTDLIQDPQALTLIAHRVLAQSRKKHLLLVIDQFEEVFTQGRDDDERKAFIENLIHAADPANPQPLTILLVLRADFYDHLASNNNLRDLVSQNQEYIGAMSRDEQTQAILKPAAQGDWKVQEGLTDVILDDLGSEPGTLPLLSHALLETWKRRRGRVITLSGYKEAGGVKGAIAQTAESVYSKFTTEKQAIARMIFIKLTAIREIGTPYTRRTAPFPDLEPHTTHATALEEVLDTLANHRLVTISTRELDGVRVVDVAHEALIREWQTLKGWLENNHHALFLQQQLVEDAGNWINLKRDPGALYRGIRLLQILEWAKNSKNLIDLTGDKQGIGSTEREFLDASRVNEGQERARQSTLVQAQWIEAILPLVILYTGISSEIVMFFWKQIFGFAIVGSIRGWAKELFTVFGVVLALTLNYVVRRYIPIAMNLPETDVSLFWMRTIILIVMLYLSQLVLIKFPRFALLAAGQRVQDGFLGFFMGAINAWLFSGSILYYIHVADYPSLNVGLTNILFSKPTDPALLQTINQMMLYMPPHLLGDPGIYFVFIFTLLFVLVVYIEPTDKIWVVTSRFFREKLFPIFYERYRFDE